MRYALLALCVLLIVVACAPAPHNQEETYVFSFILDEIGPDTPRVISFGEQYDVLNLSYGWPGRSPLAMWRAELLQHPFSIFPFAELDIASAPLNRTLYVSSFIPESVSGGFVFNTQTFFDYAGFEDCLRVYQEFVHFTRNTPSQNQSFAFGSTGVPGSFMLSSTSFYHFNSYFTPYLVRFDESSFCQELVRFPRLELYQNEELINATSLRFNQDFHYTFTENAYRGVLEFNTYVDVPSRVLVSAEFFGDGSQTLPLLLDVDVSKMFVPEQELTIHFSFFSDAASYVWYRQGADWVEISHLQDGLSRNATFTPATSEPVDIRLRLEDPSGANQTYLFHNISRVFDTSVHFSMNAPSLSPFSAQPVEGHLLSDNGPLVGALVRAVYNGEVIDTFRTGSQGFFSYTANLPFGEEYPHDFGLVLPRVGVYDYAGILFENSVSALDYDVAIIDVQTSPYFVTGVQEVNVTLQNVGLQPIDGVLTAQTLTLFGAVINATSTSFSLDSQQEQTYTLSVSYDVINLPGVLSVFAESELDQNEFNNVFEKDIFYRPEYYLQASLFSPENDFTSSEAFIEVDILDAGARLHNNMTYNLSVFNVSNGDLLFSVNNSVTPLYRYLQRYTDLPLSLGDTVFITLVVSAFAGDDPVQVAAEPLERTLITPIPSVHHDVTPMVLSVGEQSDIVVEVFNDGEVPVLNYSINISLAHALYDGFILSDSAFSFAIEEILVGESVFFNVSVVPDIKSRYSVTFQASWEGRSDLHSGFTILRAAAGSVDGAVVVQNQNQDVFSDTMTIPIAVFNRGLDTLPPATLVVSVDNEPIQSIAIPSIEDAYVIDIFHVVSEPREYVVSANLSVLGDVDLSDNTDSRVYRRYSSVDVLVNFSLFDDFLRLARFTFGGFQTTVFDLAEPAVTTLPLATGELRLRIEYNESDFLAILPEFTPSSSLSWAIGFWPEVEDHERRFFFVQYVNQTEYFWSSNKVIREPLRSAMPFENLHELEYYSCDVFDPNTQSCMSSWVEIPREVQLAWITQSVPVFAQAIAMSTPPWFAGESTDLRTAPDLVENLTFERVSTGKITFSSEVNVSSLRDRLAELPDLIIIDGLTVSVNASLDVLSSVPAEILLRQVPFVNPQILYNGTACPSSRCHIITHNQGGLLFSVSGFSTYEVIEGPFCGDGVCNAQETCSTCPQDCGVCPVDSPVTPPPPSFGGGGAPPAVSEPAVESPVSEEDAVSVSEPVDVCVPDWVCEWSDCVNGQQERVCTDSNNCDSDVGRPSAVVEECGIVADESSEGVSFTPEENGGAVQVTSRWPGFLTGGMIVLVMLMIGVLSWAFFSGKQPSSQKSVSSLQEASVLLPAHHQLKAPVQDPYVKAREYVAGMRRNGVRDDMIRASFRNGGWKEEDIEKVM